MRLAVPSLHCITVLHAYTQCTYLHQLQCYLGHAHIETTTVYTHLTPINHVEAIGYIDTLIEPILRR